MINNDKLQREKVIFRYIGAMERGDIDALIAILKDAEVDPILTRMIAEVHDAYEIEDPIRLVNSNGNKSRQELKMLSSSIAISRPQRAMPTTLIAAMLIFALIGSLLFGALNRKNINTFNATQSDVTATATPTIPTTQAYPLRTFQGVMIMKGLPLVQLPDGKSIISKTAAQSISEAHYWLEAPNKSRAEFFGSDSSSPTQDLYKTAVIDTPITPGLHPNTVVVSDGRLSWQYWTNMGAPSASLATSVIDLSTLPTQDTSLQALIQHTSQSMQADVKSLGTDTFLGRPVYVLDARPRPNATNGYPQTRIVLKFDQATGLQVSYQGYDSNGTLFSDMSFTSLTINQPIDPKVFTLILPSDVWTANSTNVNNPNSWTQFMDQARFDIFEPAFDAKYALVPGFPAYDAFSGLIHQPFYDSKDVYGAVPLEVWEGLRSGITSTLNIPPALPDGSDQVKLGQFTGTVREDGSYRWLVVDEYDTEIVLRTRVFNRDDLVALVDSFQYKPPKVSNDDIGKAWDDITHKVYYPVFKPESANTLVNAGKRLLYARLPVLTGPNNAIIKQEFFAEDKPGTVLTLEEGTYDIYLDEFGTYPVYNSGGEEVKIGDQTATYFLKDGMQWLVVNLGSTYATTYLIIEAQPDVPKDTLIRLVSPMTPMPYSTPVR